MLAQKSKSFSDPFHRLFRGRNPGDIGHCLALKFAADLAKRRRLGCPHWGSKCLVAANV